MILILGALVLLAAVIIGGDAVLNKTSTDHDEVDEAALHEFSVYAAAEEVDQTWNDVTVSDHAILHMWGESHYSYLVNPDSEVSSLFATQVTLSDNPGNLTVYRLSLLYPRLWSVKALGGNFNTIDGTTIVLDNKVYCVKFDEESLTAPYSSEHVTTFLAHESFHYYGQADWDPSSRFLADLTEADYGLMAEKLELLDQVRASLAHSNEAELR